MTDFIFNVDLSTTYVILRRDFFTPQDETGHLSSPVGATFYYDAASANAAARAHCTKEAKEAKEDPNGLGLMSESPVHFERDGLYIGGCVTREEGRDRFEVRVSRLKARGGWNRNGGGGGGGEMVEGDAGRGVSRGGGGGGLAVVGEEGEEGEGDRERPETPLLRPTGSKIGRLFSRKKGKP
ncbi:hypothetical protein VMCG_06468 [Cytospora schulzeri]|uniref:Uncharacterized protein n=1 Tax=Cytospora schulzeri TaxID=448051 RepID=A0A423WBQ4_9PEZI|nr:hypothetical protein VMCG_06468 [Valsa malicola]